MGRGRARWLIFGERQGKGRREGGGRGGRDEFDGDGVAGGVVFYLGFRELAMSTSSRLSLLLCFVYCRWFGFHRATAIGS